jgi:methylmalonyl-CoA/ethylmalonyl-CoA epimerase
MFLKIDHVAVLVWELNEAIQTYESYFDVKISSRVVNEVEGFEVASFAVGDAHFELLSPIRSDSTISGILNKRGPGIHHIAVEVEDVAQSMQELSWKGVKLTSNTPKHGSGETLISFVHPKSLFGTMLELVELPK